MRKKVDVWLNTKRFFSFLAPYKLQFGFLMLIIFTFESTYYIEKYVFKLIIDGATNYSTGIIGRDPFISLITALVIVVGIMLIIRPVGKWTFIHLLNRIVAVLIADVKRKFFNHLVRLDYNFHTTNKTGSIISRMTRGGRSIEGMMDSISFNFASLVIQMGVGIYALSTVGWNLTLAAIIIAFLFLSYSVWLFSKQLPANIKANKVEDFEKANISDIFMNIDSIKYFGKEELIKKKYFDLSERTRLSAIRMWDYFRWADSVQSLILTSGMMLILAIAIRDFFLGVITMGDVVFAVTVFLTMVWPMYGSVFGMRNYYRAMADFESLYEYDEFENQIKDKKGAENIVITNGVIEFKDVSFKYHDDDLFKKFNLVVEKNTKVALVGHSGAGKSTLVKLLYRMYDVQEGQITIDGVAIDGVTQESLRSELSIVPQECVLFDDTIWNNIAFSNAKASKEDVWNAIRFSQLDRLIEKLPKKEHTVVGERGVKLSGGEKQRVSIARALLADKKVLVLDEATSSLDSHTENEIQKDLQDLMKGRTSIIIAHRLSTIMSADKIVVIEEGKVVQSGKHADLIDKEGPYKHLWELQRGGYIG